MIRIPNVDFPALKHGEQRFFELSVGRCFLFAGEVFRKTASNVASGHDRIANVFLYETPVQPLPESVVEEGAEGGKLKTDG